MVALLEIIDARARRFNELACAYRDEANTHLCSSADHSTYVLYCLPRAHEAVDKARYFSSRARRTESASRIPVIGSLVKYLF